MELCCVDKTVKILVIWHWDCGSRHWTCGVGGSKFGALADSLGLVSMVRLVCGLKVLAFADKERVSNLARTS